jgi:ketosteroid isomerase-like protein
MKIQDLFNLEAMNRAFKNKDIETLLSFYSKTAKIVQVAVRESQKKEFVGHEEIALLYQGLFNDIFDYEYFDQTVIVVENTALFTFQWAELEQGKRKSSNFASWVLQKEVDGKWRIVIDTYRC